MTIERDPRLRKKNKNITFLVPSKTEVEVGDVVCGQQTKDALQLRIDVIDNRRPATMSGFDHITAKFI
jgi:hypothetical protein